MLKSLIRMPRPSGLMSLLRLQSEQLGRTFSETANYEDEQLRTVSEDHSRVKITLPNWALSAFIGRNGENIKAVREKHSLSKIKTSRDGFPHLREQVVMIEGVSDSVIQIVHEVSDFHQNLPVPDNDEGRAKRRQKGVRFVIPSSSAGMFIGKGGKTAVQIKEQFKLDILDVRVSPVKGIDDFHEKSMYIYGEDANMTEAVDYMIKKMKDGPLVDENLSYRQFYN